MILKASYMETEMKSKNGRHQHERNLASLLTQYSRTTCNSQVRFMVRTKACKNGQLE